jgi:AcrR family transcriptional regulator
MRDLMSASGVKAGNFYFHFDSKKALALAVMDEAEGIFFDVMNAACGAEGLSPAQKLGAMMGALAALIEARDCAGGCLFANFALEMSDADPELRERTAVFFERWRLMIEKIVRDARREGELPSNIDSSGFSEYIIMALEGGIMLSRLKKDPAPLKYAFSTLRDHIFSLKEKNREAGE